MKCTGVALEEEETKGCIGVGSPRRVEEDIGSNSNNSCGNARHVIGAGRRCGTRVRPPPTQW